MEDQISGPFVGPFPFWNGAWHHQHLFEKIDNKNSRVIDKLDYDFPMNPFGTWFGGWYTKKRLKQMFAYRRNITQNDIKAQSKYNGKKLDIAVTGSNDGVNLSNAPGLSCQLNNLSTGTLTSSDDSKVCFPSILDIIGPNYK